MTIAQTRVLNALTANGGTYEGISALARGARVNQASGRKWFSVTVEAGPSPGISPSKYQRVKRILDLYYDARELMADEGDHEAYRMIEDAGSDLHRWMVYYDNGEDKPDSDPPTLKGFKEDLAHVGYRVVPGNPPRIAKIAAVTA